ncbi:polycystin-1-like protein 2 isoform X4 [Hydra vulgaris]|uniref:polycystin-1-like protein 2 isoform X4 n=1 Tax=Hydra vulgaris TaxID=6087 RepID=UPI001F5F953E|nr:polycystic kidney disease protein 1-like 2 isoform X5 [Hydra vulgaris]
MPNKSIRNKLILLMLMCMLNDVSTGLTNVLESTWSNWSFWSNCTVSCGFGTMSRTRVCSGLLCNGNSIDIVSCYGNQTCTGMQSGWSNWSIWSSCTVSCDNGTMTRIRLCLDLSSSCVGNTIETANCYSNVTCSGLQLGWSEWSLWSLCNVSCGNGTVSRIRECLDVVNPCVGDSIDEASCYNNETCLGVELGWSEWSFWSLCDVSCGNGTMSRVRLCLDVMNPCIGNSIEVTSCYNSTTCLGLQLGWSEWSFWSLCDVSCGNGTMSRGRLCLDVMNPCIGNSIEVASCYINITCLGLQLGWSEWSFWSLCDVSCGNGTLSRVRLCLDVMNSCVGNSIEVASCYNNITCSGLQLGWSEWSFWSFCNVSCGNGTMSRVRLCLDVMNPCIGNSIEVASCYNNITCLGLQLGWSEWSFWSLCDVSCGNGTMSRVRLCLDLINPCMGNNIEVASCYNNITCLGLQLGWSEWSFWSLCDVSCGNGTMSRVRLCLDVMNPCMGNSIEVASCYNNITCLAQCDLLSQIEKCVIVPINILQNATFDIVFMLQNMDFKCIDTSALNINNNIDTSVLSLQLELDFGDDTSKVGFKNCVNSSNEYTFSHSFKDCGNYTIKYIIKSCNAMGSFINVEIINYVKVTVFCLMSPIKMVTDLISDLNQNFVLPLNKELSLLISQDLGSYIKYAIDWGDSVVQLIDQSQNKNPLPFVLSHTYKNAGNYTAVLEANNTLQVTNIKIFVKILNCSFPKVTFQYGSKDNPLRIVNTNKDFVANVDESDNACLPSNISVIWILTGDNITSKSQGTLSNNRIVYSLGSNLDFGTYILSLLFTYNMLTTIHVSYFMIVNLPILIEIDNGAFRTVAYKQKQSVNNFFPNFTISALVSSGGSLPTIEHQRLVYKWKCRVKNTSLTLNKLNSQKAINSTFENSTCFNESWMDITVDGPELVFSTKMFIEEVTYQFQVIGTNLVGKYLQSSSFIQEIVFRSGDLPNGQINCITNCAAKLNTKEKTVFMFSSLKIIGISFTWEVLNDYDEWPKELQHKNSTATGFSGSYLVINPDTLLISKNYYFVLTVGYVGSSNKASFKIKKQTSSVPIPGSCFVSPQIGYAVITRFKLICQDWTDNENSILRYEFFYDSGVAEKYIMTGNGDISYPLLNAKSPNDPLLVDFVLGPGNLNKNFSARIYVRVVGIYKAYTQYPDIFIQVLPFPNNVLNVIANAGIPDTTTFSSFLHAVSNVLNHNSNAVKMLSPKTIDNITGFTDVNNEIVLKKEDMLVQQQSVRTKVVHLLSKTPLSSLTDIKNVGDALAIVLTVPEELTSQTKTNAVDIITNMSSLLTEKNIKDVGPHLYDQITQPFVASISHLFSGLANSDGIVEPVESLNSTFAPGYISKQENNNSQLVLKLIQSMDKYFDGLQYHIANDEDPTIGDTPAFKFFLKKVYGIYSGNISTGSSEENNDEHSGFSIFNLTSFLNESTKYSSVVIKNLNIRSQPFTWDSERSKNIVSESQILYLSATTGQKIEVKNLSSTVNISIKNIPQKMNGRNISLSMPYDVQTSLLELPSSECSLMMKFSPLNDPQNKTNLIVYIQYGKVPTNDDYDIKLNISTRDGTDLIIGNNTPRSNFSINIQRSQKCRLLKDGSIILWDFHNSTYSFLNKTFLHLSYFYVGPMPEKILEFNPYTLDGKEYYGTYLYEMKSFCLECNYWNENANKWMSDGCELDVFTTSFLLTKCKCNHLTAFGGFFVAPNALPKPSLALLKTGYVLLVTVTVVILLWIVGLVWSRRMDESDASKIGVCPLLDNHPRDHYLYQIKVDTGNRRNSGTKSNIFFTVTGDISDSGIRRLKDSVRECFQRSSCDIFIMTTQSSLGDLSYIRLWHDNSGGGWYLNTIVITDLQTEKQFLFIGHRWIAVDQGMCTLDCIIPVASAEESKSFTFVYTSKVERNLTDEHLWFSIFTRPPRSNFTRCQRLTVAVSLLLTSMMVSTMFYGKEGENPNPATENKSVFSFTKTQIFVVLISTVIKFPVHLLFLKFFRSIRPLEITSNSFIDDSSVNESSSEQLSSEFIPLSKRKSIHLSKTTLTIIITEDKPLKKKKFLLPHWCLYVAWFLCVGNIFVCVVIIVLYGMKFGNATSLNWLASITIDFTKEILLIEPIKIFILAIFVAVVVKEVNEEETEFENRGKKLAHDEHWLYKLKNEPTIYDMESIKLQPLDSLTLKKMKELKIKKLKMTALIQEMFIYAFYAALVFFISYSTNENVACYQNRNIEELFNLKLRGVPMEIDNFKVYDRIQSTQDFWPWMEEYFIQQVFPEPWFNLSEFYANSDKKDFPGKLFLNDLNSKIVNGIRIRQLRVQPNSCIKANLVAEFFKIDCLSSYNSAVEETQDFDFNWTRPIKYKSAINPFTMPWRYQTWKELDGYPYRTDLDTYYGGGYAVEIFPKWNNKAILDRLKELRWIDRRTRAVIIEYALFNAATNYFTMATIFLEFPASGGVVPRFTVLTFKLYISLTGSKAVLGSHIIFVLMTILFAVRECRLLLRTGIKYFVEFWNLVEAVLVILSVIAVGFFFFKNHLAKVLLERITDKKPQTFINFQFASYWNLAYVYVVALIVFFVTLKFIKLLRFNQRVSMLSSTLNVAWYPFSMFGIIFFIILCSVITTASIVFGPLLEGYQNYFKAIGSIVSLLLGKFSYYQFEKANSVLGPIFFFGFNFIVLWIVMNIFVSILNDAFSIVREDIQNKANEYEMVEFVLDHFKGWFGWRVPKMVVSTNQYNNVHRSESNDYLPTNSKNKSEINKNQSIKYNEASKPIHAVEFKNSISKRILKLSKYDHLLQERELNSNENGLLEKFNSCMKSLTAA